MYDNFGFKDNIFNTKALDLCEADLNKFIGRVKDIKSFIVDISSVDSAVVIVTGHRGVGKTSFVNVMEYSVGLSRSFLHRHIDVNIPQIIPCYHKIQIEPNEKVKSILSKSMSSLLFSIQQFSEEKKLKLPKKIKELTRWVSELSVFTKSTGQLTLGGFGGSVSHSKSYKNISEIPTNVLQELIRQIIEEIKKSFKVDGIFLNINNIDILEEKNFCDIFNQLRDYLFNIKGLWSVVIGQPGLYSSLYQQAARVAEVISGQATELNPLSEEDIIAVLNIRRKIYAKNSKKIPPLPIEEDFIRKIYKNSDGEIRTVLKACDDIVRFAFKNNPNIRGVKEESGKVILKNILEQQLSLENLKLKDKEIIERIFKKGNLRPRDYKELKLKSAVDFTNKTSRLLTKNLLKKEVRGNTANYKVTGVIHLAKYAKVDFA